MNTTNLISTPDITGNIGSCNTSVERVVTYNRFFTQEGFTLATNSCDGTVVETPYYSSAGIGVFIGVFLVIAFFSWLIGYFMGGY